MLVIDPHYNFNLTMSYSLGLAWWGEYTPEIISISRHEFLDTINRYRNDARKKVVLINLADFFHENFDLSWTDLVIFFTTEALEETTQSSIDQKLQKRFNPKKFIVIAGAANCNLTLDERYYIRNPETITKVVCSNDPYTADYTNKDKLFDALLGTPKTFRQYIFEKIRRYNFLDDSLVSIHSQQANWTTSCPYFSVFSSPYGIGIPDYESPELSELETQEINNTKIVNDSHTVYQSAGLAKSCMKSKEQLNVWYPHLQLQDPPHPITPIHMFHPSLSQIIPSRIYDRTWYSLLSETYCHEIPFITEKTAKCLLARRMFVTFGSQNQNKLLHSYGYKTFDSVLNENYDQIRDPEVRFAEAWNTVDHLAQSDFQNLYTGLFDILEHNYKTILDLHTPYRNLQTFITRFVQSIF